RAWRSPWPHTRDRVAGHASRREGRTGWSSCPIRRMRLRRGWSRGGPDKNLAPTLTACDLARTVHAVAIRTGVEVSTASQLGAVRLFFTAVLEAVPVVPWE